MAKRKSFLDSLPGLRPTRVIKKKFKSMFHDF